MRPIKEVIQIREFLSTKTVTIKEISEETNMRIYRKLLILFCNVTDDREDGKVIYKLNELILMMFLSVLGGADNCCEMSVFWESQFRTYRKIFRKEEIPSHDTFRRILGLIDTKEMAALVAATLVEADSNLRKSLGLPAPRIRQICVDGKRARGTGRENTAAHGRIQDLQILNVYDSFSDTCLYSEPIETKTNEIPHAQDILSKMTLKDTVVSFDAMHTQSKTINIIAERKGDYVGGLKGNQKALCEYAKGLFTNEKMAELSRMEDCYTETREIAHNQLEIRTFFLAPLTSSQKNSVFKDWKKIHALVCYRKETVHNITGKRGLETRFYVTSLKTVQDASACIREHWAVENKLHHGLDTVFMEDFMELTDRTAATNKSTLNKLCLALLRKIQSLQDKKVRVSKRIMRKKFGWTFTKQMKEALTLLDKTALNNCLVIEPKKQAGQK